MSFKENLKKDETELFKFFRNLPKQQSTINHRHNNFLVTTACNCKCMDLKMEIISL